MKYSFSRYLRRIGYAITPLVMLVAAAVPAHAAGGWVQLPANLSPTVSMKKIAFSWDGTYGIAVGSSGRVARTADGGKTWTVASVGSATHNAVVFAPNENFQKVAWMVSSDGGIRKTEDAGASWTVEKDISEALYGVYAESAANVWAVGFNKILRSKDIGETWVERTVNGTWRDIHVVTDNMVGILVGDSGALVRMTNGGQTNFGLAAFTDEAPDFFTKHLYSVTRGFGSYWAVGQDQTVLKSQDGMSWATAPGFSALSGSPDYTDIAIKTGSTTYGIIAGADGYIWETANGGVTWPVKGPYILPSGKRWNGTAVVGTDNQFLVGDNGVIARWDAVPPTSVSGLVMTSGSGNVTNDTTPTFTWAASSDAETSVADYQVTLDSSSTFNTGGATTWTPANGLSAGSHNVAIRAKDAAGNITAGSGLGFTIDLTKPTVGAVSPSTAVAGQPVTFTVAVSDAQGVKSCALYPGTGKLDMALSGATEGIYLNAQASASYTFPSAGSYQVHVQCLDLAGNEQVGGTTTVNASAPVPSSCPHTPGLLVKLPDDGNIVTQEDSAVYYYASDCKRHAFPNSKVYFTWYPDFSGVSIVSGTTLASMPLGKNVTYRPGVKMVKFTTVNQVYAVTKGGVLRWVKSEELATALYGSDWNKKIDDISDAFYVNYGFGTDILNSFDYNPTAEMNAVQTIDQNL